MKKRLPTAADRRALLLQLLLVLALLVAQTAAQAHVYSHLRSDTPKSDFNGTASQLCSECLSSAPLLSAAGAPAAARISFVAEVAGIVAAAVAPRFQSSPHFAFRSRAPPELL